MNFIQRGYIGRIEWYWYLITLVLVFVFWQILGVIPLAVVAFLEAGSINEFQIAAKDAFISLGIDSNLYLFLALLTLISALVGLIIGVKYKSDA